MPRYLTDAELMERKAEIFALQRAAQDPEKVRQAHKRFVAWQELKKAGKLPAYERVGA
jgi:hypothetical protein